MLRFFFTNINSNSKFLTNILGKGKIYSENVILSVKSNFGKRVENINICFKLRFGFTKTMNSY